MLSGYILRRTVCTIMVETDSWLEHGVVSTEQGKIEKSYQYHQMGNKLFDFQRVFPA